MPGRIYSRLLELATDRYGYVSTDDARRLEVSPRRLKLLVERGSLVKRARLVVDLRGITRGTRIENVVRL